MYFTLPYIDAMEGAETKQNIGIFGKDTCTYLYCLKNPLSLSSDIYLSSISAISSLVMETSSGYCNFQDRRYYIIVLLSGY